MLSGAGRTLANLLEQIRAGRLPASVELVIASRETAGAQKAREAGARVEVIPGAIPAERLGALLREHRIDWVVLAGYLRYVNIPRGYEGRVVNIHPALLPAHGGAGMYGHHVHKEVIRAGEAESGCTVHLVDEQYDHGPVLLQKKCRVLPGDTAESLAARVFALECEAYPEALRRLISGDRRGDGRV
jgi:phosphoribosylglycinamide formyltransferase-1